jgi:purine-nucleoside phosphorylase
LVRLRFHGFPVYARIKEAADLIRTRYGARCSALSGKQPVLGLILGSGLGAFADSFQNRIVIPFSDLPHFPSPTVPGHSGNLVAGYVDGVRVIAVQGRVHLYEGFSAAEVAFPSRVLGSLGIRRLIVTNTAGGINPVFRPGDLMLITDHINMMGTNPLIGPNVDEVGPRFPDMSEAYDAGMRDIALKAAKQEKIKLRQGVYLGLPGPSYETPAEIRMCRALGADAVGMSTIPEVIAANHMGIRVLGISCITNMAAGILPQKLTHEEVIDTAEKASGKFQSLLRTTLPQLLTPDS